jgi:hypothetical protein
VLGILPVIIYALFLAYRKWAAMKAAEKNKDKKADTER